MQRSKLKTKIVGILNVTPDSFSDGGKFFTYEFAINHLRQLLMANADVIDVGAESTRPGATPITVEEEWQRLEKILPHIVFEVKKFNLENNKKVEISIDSYHFTTIKKAWELGADIVNDVSGLADEKIIEFIAKNNITTILMHNLAIHADSDLVINQHLSITEEILNWARKKISYLEKNGVKKSQLIFDPGIGFAKNAEQSIRILKNIDDYRILGLPLYIGHSKKSFLDKIDEKNLDRAQKTLLVSKYLLEKNIEFIRVHDVAEHVSLRGHLKRF